MRSSACSCRSASSGCSTPTGRPSPPTRTDDRARSTRRVARAGGPARAALDRAARQRRHAAARARRLRVAVVGPRADAADAMMGCYAFPVHVGSQHPDVPVGIEATTVLEALRADGGVRRDLCERDARCSAATTTGSRPRARGAAPRTFASRCSAIRPGCSAAAPRARAATPPTCASRGARRSCSRRCSRRERRSCSCCWSGAPTSCRARPSGSRRSSAPSTPARRAGRRSPTCCPGAVNPSGRLPVHFPAAGASQPSTYLAPALGGSQ